MIITIELGVYKIRLHQKWCFKKNLRCIDYEFYLPYYGWGITCKSNDANTDQMNFIAAPSIVI